jgi:hypothetical protein
VLVLPLALLAPALRGHANLLVGPLVGIVDDYPPAIAGKPYVWRRAPEENLQR